MNYKKLCFSPRAGTAFPTRKQGRIQVDICMKVFLVATGVGERTTASITGGCLAFFRKKAIFSFCVDVVSNLDRRRLCLCYSSFQLELITSVREEHSILKKQHYLSSHVVLSSLMATIIHLSQEDIFSVLFIDHQEGLSAALMPAKTACRFPLYGSMSKLSLIASYSLHFVCFKQSVPYWMNHTITCQLLDFYNILYRCHVSGGLYVLNLH